MKINPLMKVVINSDKFIIGYLLIQIGFGAFILYVLNFVLWYLIVYATGIIGLSYMIYLCIKNINNILNEVD